MRHFSYYLYENFDAAAAAGNPLNPRAILGASADPILARVADSPPGECGMASCLRDFGAGPVRQLTDAGVLREEQRRLFFDCPVFLREDASALLDWGRTSAARLVGLLEPALPRLYALCSGIQNGFPVELNLYHLLCGRVFDGLFFDYLRSRGALATSRPHPGGLDYLVIIYEDCPELESLSRSLLCSYNRLADANCALQSLGDSHGERRDLYRFFRLLEGGSTSAPWLDEARELLGDLDAGGILAEVPGLLLNGSCSARVRALLEFFGYIRDGAAAVPVYSGPALDTASELERTVEAHIGESAVLAISSAHSLRLSPNAHGAAPAETANELYHILFGCINGELVRRGFVAPPPFRPGEGRYLKSMELYLSSN